MGIKSLYWIDVHYDVIGGDASRAPPYYLTNIVFFLAERRGGDSDFFGTAAFLLRFVSASAHAIGGCRTVGPGTDGRPHEAGGIAVCS